jgi:folylpolyglutamate synthase/dihydropteroate synthase
MRDKNVTAIVRTLVPLVSHVIATAAPTPRARPAEDLAAYVRDAGVTQIIIEPDADRAVDRALELSPTVCVAGSIFLVGAVRNGLIHRAILR